MDARPPNDARIGPENATAQAAELAEQIVDEVSRAEQDWQRISVLADRLAGLAAVVADPVATDVPRSSPPQDPPDSRDSSRSS